MSTVCAWTHTHTHKVCSEQFHRCCRALDSHRNECVICLSQSQLCGKARAHTHIQAHNATYGPYATNHACCHYFWPPISRHAPTRLAKACALNENHVPCFMLLHGQENRLFLQALVGIEVCFYISVSTCFLRFFFFLTLNTWRLKLGFWPYQCAERPLDLKLLLYISAMIQPCWTPALLWQGRS